MTIKALVFDMGGVLLRTEDLSGRRKWEARFGLPDWGLANIVFNSPTALSAAVGQSSTNDVWLAVQQRLDLTAEQLLELQSDFWSGDRFDEPLLEWIAARRNRYRTALLSNAWNDVRQFLNRHSKVAQAFDLIVISAEEGVMKPDRRIYDRALARLRVEPHEAVFVDDVLENVEAAQAAGWQAVHYTAGLNVPQALSLFGVG